jgi:hypothetical protein
MPHLSRANLGTFAHCDKLNDETNKIQRKDIEQPWSIRPGYGKPEIYRAFVDSRATLKPESQANRSAKPSPTPNGHSA